MKCGEGKSRKCGEWKSRKSGEWKSKMLLVLTSCKLDAQNSLPVGSSVSSSLVCLKEDITGASPTRCEPRLFHAVE